MTGHECTRMVGMKQVQPFKLAVLYARVSSNRRTCWPIVGDDSAGVGSGVVRLRQNQHRECRQPRVGKMGVDPSELFAKGIIPYLIDIRGRYEARSWPQTFSEAESN
jgi:hypothetical protein